MMNKVANTPLQRWWKQATKQDKDTLSRLAKVPLGQLGQLAGGHRVSSAAPARRIEIATVRMAKTKNLPVVLRSTLCPACSVCEYARECKK